MPLASINRKIADKFSFKEKIKDINLKHFILFYCFMYSRIKIKCFKRYCLPFSLYF